MIQNAHLEGGSFAWRAGSTGILLIHGFTATTAEVRPLAQALYSAGFSVSAPLLPGHGTTPEEANRCTWQDWLNAIQAAYEQLQAQCETVFIAGESMGSLIALNLAAHTPQICGVIAYAPAIKLRSSYIAPTVRLLAAFRSSIKKPFTQPTVVDTLWQGYPVYPLKSMIQFLKLQSQTLAILPAIHQPLLIIQGRKDRSLSPHAPEIMISRVKSSSIEIHWMEDSGHCVILDSERANTIQITQDFITKILLSDSANQR
ncbi:MAG: carboxylesterase [Chloroflexi bacterium]|nr:carboxylesterase [Chloroflexota bacterium]